MRKRTKSSGEKSVKDIKRATRGRTFIQTSDGGRVVFGTAPSGKEFAIQISPNGAIRVYDVTDKKSQSHP